MLIIGITGGSGSGKSTVADILCSFGAETIDADVVYHDLLNNSEAMKSELKKRFPETITDEGKLSRKALAKIVFSDKEALSDLNQIAHKFVIQETERKLEELYRKNVPYICIDAIALFESKLSDICDATIGVIAPRALRLSRITARDGIDNMAASARINAQEPDEFFRERCDYIIENAGDISAVTENTKEIFDLITKGLERNE
ncbi:MAG: dephospho-CoA kinase [Oscillospiraceae bacterium]|nr:dephospho-CoA kinase [Oscillospiraceae bacterium]